MQLCKLTNVINHGSVIQLFLEPVEGESKRPIVITGDHRPLWQFLTDWDAAGRPTVYVSDDRETLQLDN